MPSFDAAPYRLLLVLSPIVLAACSGEASGSANPTGNSGAQAGAAGSVATSSGGQGGSSGAAGAGPGGSAMSGGAAGTMITSGAGGTVGACQAFAQSYGSEEAMDQNAIAGAVVPAGGGVIVAGDFAGKLHVSAATLASAGGQDAFAVRLGPGGAVAWAKRFGAAYDDRIKGIAATPGGGAVLVGTFDGAVDFGGKTLTSIAGPDAFVMKLDQSGGLDFVLQFENAEARAVTVEDGGNILVAGDFYGTTKFGQVTLTSMGSDMFAARLSADGKVQTAQRYASQAKAGVIAIASGAGRTYLAGSFQSTINLGSGELVSAGSKDVFLARLDDNLNPTFAKAYGDDTSQEGRAIAVLSDGSAVLAGGFRGVLDFDGTVLTADTQDDAFVARVDTAGKTVFARSFGDAAAQHARAVAAGASDRIFVGGGFQGTIDVGDGPKTSAAGEDVFVAELDAAGAAVKTVTFGGTADQRARALAIDPCGAVVLGGDFTGALPIGAEMLMASGGLDVFVARLAP